MNKHTNLEIAKDFQLWMEYVDTTGEDSECFFENLSIAGRLEFMQSCGFQDQGEENKVVRAKDLTQQQRELFSEEFYLHSQADDLESSSPWGCPWYWCKDEILLGETIEAMAYNFHLTTESEIEKCIEKE
jgi:hypothetical protein